MIQVIVDLYPSEKAFYPHVASPELSRESKDTLSKQFEWKAAMLMMARIAKHFRRVVGYTDRRNVAAGEPRV